MDDFERHVEGMHENDNHEFSLEYSVIIVFTPVYLLCIMYHMDLFSSLEKQAISNAYLQRN